MPLKAYFFCVKSSGGKYDVVKWYWIEALIIMGMEYISCNAACSTPNVIDIYIFFAARTRILDLTPSLCDARASLCAALKCVSAASASATCTSFILFSISANVCQWFLLYLFFYSCVHIYLRMFVYVVISCFLFFAFFALRWHAFAFCTFHSLAWHCYAGNKFYAK